MIDLTRPSLVARFAGLALIGTVAALAPAAALAAPRPASAPHATTAPDSCNAALEYERTAARDDVPRQAAYDSAVAGLAANIHCSEPQMRLVNEAYLLSMRAPAEHDLHIGDWNRDLTRANALLTQCTGYPGLARTKVAADCRTQIAGNQHVAAVFAAQAAAAAATPKPAASPMRSASPVPAATMGPRAPVALPTPPAPHRS